MENRGVQVVLDLYAFIIDYFLSLMKGGSQRMVPKVDLVFFDTAKYPVSAGAKSDVLFNNTGDSFTVQITGDAGITFSLLVEGNVDSEAMEEADGFVPLWMLSAKDASVKKDGVLTEKGIYCLGCDGIKHIRMTLTSLSGGDIKVYGQTVNTGV